MHLLQRNKVYTVGDITYSSNLPSYAYLECVTAGTTAVTEPSGISAATVGALITDGTVVWKVCKVANDSDVYFSVIYPNGGTAASPATITVNSRYIETNPFPGYNVICQVQCLVNGKWVDIDWTGGYTGGTSYGCGAKASLYDGNIILQTGNYTALIHSSNMQGNALGNNSAAVASAPARILVWKIGRNSKIL